jgi:hypothetical protein
MRVSFRTNAAVLAIVHTMATLSMAASSGDVQEDRVSSMGAILTLDAAIQKRFEKVDGTFGIRRIIPPAYTAHGFAPENAAEISSLRELEDAQLRVVFYLAGRGVLESQAEERRARVLETIKGPAYITRGLSSRLPDAASMSIEARRAFAAFERKEPYYDFEAGDWNVVARPVRAAEDTCLNCHWSTGDHGLTGGRSGLRVGDVLGVALYAYQTANR